MTPYSVGKNGFFYPLSYDDIKVAGYDLSGIHIFCAYPAEDGRIIPDSSKSEFYLAYNNFDVLDTQGTFDDLREKLSSIYGSYEENVDEGHVTYYFESGPVEYNLAKKSIVWTRGNTSVKMYCVFDVDAEGPQQGTVYIYYGRTDYDEKLENLNRLKYLELVEVEQNNRTNETNGL